MRVEVYPDREVVVDFDPSLTFECVDDCTWCCRHGVLLYEKDLLELAARESLAEAIAAFRGRDFLRRERLGLASGERSEPRAVTSGSDDTRVGQGITGPVNPRQYFLSCLRL